MNNQSISDVFHSELSNEMKRWGIGPVHITTIKGILEQALIEAKEQDTVLSPLGVFEFKGCSHTKNLYDFSEENNKIDALDFFKFNKKKILPPEQCISSEIYKVEVRKAPPAVTPGIFEDGWDDVVGQSDAFMSFGKPFSQIAIPQNCLVDLISSSDDEFKKFREAIDCVNYNCHFLTKGKNEKDKEVYFYLSFQIDSVWSHTKECYEDNFTLEETPVDYSISDTGESRYIVFG